MTDAVEAIDQTLTRLARGGRLPWPTGTHVDGLLLVVASATEDWPRRWCVVGADGPIRDAYPVTEPRLAPGQRLVDRPGLERLDSSWHGQGD